MLKVLQKKSAGKFKLKLLKSQKVREIQIEIPQMSKKLYFLCFRSQRGAFSRNSRAQSLAFKLIYDQIDNG